MTLAGHAVCLLSHSHLWLVFCNANNINCWLHRLCKSISAVVVQDMEPSEIGSILRHPAMGRTVQDCLHSFPALSLEAQLQPITRCASTLSQAWCHVICTDGASKHPDLLQGLMEHSNADRPTQGKPGCSQNLNPQCFPCIAERWQALSTG